MSALRLYADSKRVSTAVLTKKGQFLQVYPSKRIFSSEEEWRAEWTHVLTPKITVEGKNTSSISEKGWVYTNTLCFTAPPGSYYIGDLCYVLSKDVYQNVFGRNDYKMGLYTQTGTSNFFLVNRTLDLIYKSSDGKEFAHDAGQIGITPVSFLAKNDGGGHIYTFEKPVTCAFRNGRFCFTSGYEILEITGGYGDE